MPKKLIVLLVVSAVSANLWSCDKKQGTHAKSTTISCSFDIDVIDEGELRTKLFSGQGENYVVCPFLKSSDKAKIFLIKDSSKSCYESTLFNRKIDNVKIMSSKQATLGAAACSAVFGGSEVLGSSSKSDSFLWSMIDMSDNEKSELRYSVYNIVMKSGIPVKRFHADVNQLCFELPENYTNSIKGEFSKLSPSFSGVRESVRRGSGCE